MSADGPFRVIHHGSKWSIEDVLNPTQKPPIYDSHIQAQAEADRCNQAYADKYRPRPSQPAQPGLFDTQEAAG
jgi:hypothetical protein